jgi:hypothetical protein
MRKSLATMLVLALLLVTVTQMPMTHSAELTETEMVKTFLKDVALLDVEKYEIELVNVFDENWLGASWLYKLTSSESTIEMSCNIRNNTLVSLWLNPIGGELLFIQPATDALDAAKSFMDSFQAFSQKTYLQPLQDMLNQVTEIEPMTLAEGNTTFIVEPSPVGEDYVRFNWMNWVNGIYNGYNGFSVYFRDGNFKRFSDTWNRYPVGSADAMSEEEAYSIARAAVEAYSYVDYGQTVSNLVISDEYGTIESELTMQLRGGVLYPSWYFWLPLDQMYPARVTSVKVKVWADTGEVWYIYQDSVGYVPYDPDSSSPSLSPAPSILPSPSPSPSLSPESSITSPAGVILYASAAVATIVISVVALALKKRKH